MFLAIYAEIEKTKIEKKLRSVFIFGTAALLLATAACSPTTNNPDGVADLHHPPFAKDLPPFTPPPSGPPAPSAYLLFQINQTEAEIQANKRLFAQTPIVKAQNLAPHAFDPTVFDMFNLAADRHVDLDDTANCHRMMATSPVVGTYDAPDVEVSLSIRFPEVFRNNIPNSIKNEILKYDLDSLEIYFAPQRVRGNVGAVGSEALLRTHFWYLQAPHPAGTNVAGSLLMGIYDSDHPIALDVPSDQVVAQEVSIHPAADGTTLYSPNNARLNLNQSMLDMSFWSLVIDQQGKRAVVTLHWLLNPASHLRLIGYLNVMAPSVPSVFGPPATNHLDHLVGLLDLDLQFQGHPMLQKLQNLIQ